MKTGLVLEGGGMRGIFTAGVLDYLLRHPVDIDVCIGVSAGACHAVSFISGQYGRAYDISTKYLRDKRYCGIYSFITTGDIFGVEMCYDIIPNQLDKYDYDAFAASKIEFCPVVTNCKTGEAEYPVLSDLRAENAMTYLRASASLPLLSRNVEINGQEYLDGGISDSIPLKHALEMGCDKTVVVLTQPREYVKHPNSMMPAVRRKYKAYPAFVEAMENRHRMYNGERQFVFEREKAGSTFVIAPDAPVGLRRIEKNIPKLRAVYQRGYDECERLYPKLLKYLND